MAIRELPLQEATDPIDVDDLVMTVNTESGVIILETRSIQSLRDFFGGIGTGGGGVSANYEYKTPVGQITTAITSATTIVVDSVERPPTPVTRAAELEFVLAAVGEGRVPYDDWNALTSLDSQNLPVAGLTDTNSVSISIGTIQFRVAKVTNVAGAANVNDEYFAFGASVNGTYDITINYVQLALELYADRNSPTSLVPLDRQEKELPPLGSAGQILQVNAAADGWEVANLTVTGSTDSHTLEVRTTLPAITGFDIGDIINFNGELYELVANTEDSNILRGTIFQRAGSYWGSAATGEVDFEFEGVNPFNTRLNILKTGLTSPPANLYIRVTMSSGQVADIQMDRSAGADTTTRYAYHKDPASSALDAPTAGETYRIEIFSDTGFSTAQNVHAVHRWEADNRDTPVVDTALVGNTDRWAKSKLPTDTVYGDISDLHQSIGILAENEVFPGLTLNPTSQVLVVGSANYFSPTIDLDEHPAGEFHIELDLTVVPVSDVNMAFERGVSNATDEQKNVVQSNIVFASNLAEEEDWSSTTSDGRDNGLTIFEIPLYSANTILGTYYMRLIHNNNNQVGIYYEWVGQSGATGATLNAELRTTFTPTDTGADTVRNSRGALEFRSIALPTNLTTAVLSNTQLGWVLASGSSWISNNNGFIMPPILRPANNVIGWWFVFKRSGVEFSESMIPFSWQPNYRIELQCNDPQANRDEALRVEYYNSGNIVITPQTAFTLPANSTIEVYRAVI